MNTYFELIGTDSEGEKNILFGSFNKDDCESELDAEKQYWKSAGMKNIKIVSRKTNEEIDYSVYPELIVK